MGFEDKQSNQMIFIKVLQIVSFFLLFSLLCVSCIKVFKSVEMQGRNWSNVEGRMARKGMGEEQLNQEIAEKGVRGRRRRRSRSRLLMAARKRK